VDWFRYGKGQLRQRAIETSATERARKRYEDREIRLLRDKRERAEKMTQRKQMLKDKVRQQENIRASINRAQSKATDVPDVAATGKTNGNPDDS